MQDPDWTQSFTTKFGDILVGFPDALAQSSTAFRPCFLLSFGTAAPPNSYLAMPFPSCMHHSTDKQADGVLDIFLAADIISTVQTAYPGGSPPLASMSYPTS